jgi:hypothetical protein
MEKVPATRKTADDDDEKDSEMTLNGYACEQAPQGLRSILSSTSRSLRPFRTTTPGSE